MFRIIALVLLTSSLCFSQLKVSDVIAEIKKDSIEAAVKHLQNYGTRFLLSEKRFEAANWIKYKFEQMGFTSVEFDAFECRTRIGAPYFNRQIDTVTTQVNVVATLYGTTNPEEIYIICGHYDSFAQNTNPFVEAPGADDNASGTTAVLESARAIMKSGFKPTYTIRFIAFAAEELMYFGDAGSRHYANKCYAEGDNIKMVINNDMIGYCETQYQFASVTIGHPNTFPNFDKAADIAKHHSVLAINGNGYHGADLQTFLDRGYTGLYFEESVFNTPNYHRNTDLAKNMDFNYMTEVIKAGTAILISGNEIITDVKDERVPEKFSMLQNYPNPFNPSTTIEYTISTSPRPSPYQGEGVREGLYVSLLIYDNLGREVSTLVNEYQKLGTYVVEWNASTVNRQLSSGVYYLMLKTDNDLQVRKMMLLK